MHDEPVTGTCRNCEAELHGRFCSSCGQRVPSANLGLHDFAHDAIHEFLHVDGKLFQTMRLLLFAPGQLTRDFVEGRRARHISPIRLYLLWSVICFAVVAWAGILSEAKVSLSPSAAVTAAKEGPESNSLEARLARGVDKAKADPKRMGESLVHALPKAMFLLMPVFALLVFAFYRKTQRFYVPHLYFSIHVHAFAFCLLSVCVLLGASGVAVLKLASLLMLLMVVPYFLFALRKVYGGSWAWAVAKGGAMVMAYFLLLNVTVLVVLAIPLLTI